MAEDPQDPGEGRQKKGKRRRLVDRGVRNLERIHAQGDRSAKRGLAILGVVLLAVLVVVIVAVRAGREEEDRSEGRGREVADEGREAVEPQPVAVRRKLARLEEVEGRLFWPRVPEKTRADGDDVWDGEGVAAAELGGGRARLFAGGSVEFGPGTVLHFGDGEELLLRFESGFAAFDFARKAPPGRFELAGIAGFEASPGLRLVVQAAPGRKGRPRSLYLHVRRGSGHLEFGNERIALNAGVSFAFRVQEAGAEIRELARVVYVGGGGEPPSLEVVEKGLAVELEGPRKLQPLQAETRVLARDLVDQAKGLADGEIVGVDMYVYLSEKGILDEGLEFEGGEAGDVEAPLRLLRHGETIVESNLAALAEKRPEVHAGRFERLLEERLLPVIGKEGEQTLMVYELKTETLELFARTFVRIPEEIDGRKVMLRPNIIGHQALMLRAIARAVGCVIVESGDYGVEFVPESD